MADDFWGSNLVRINTIFTLPLAGPLKSVQSRTGVLSGSGCVTKSTVYPTNAQIALNSVLHLGFDPSVDFDVKFSVAYDKNGNIVWSVNENINRDFKFQQAVIHIDSVEGQGDGVIAGQAQTTLARFGRDTFCGNTVHPTGFGEIGNIGGGDLFPLSFNATFDALPASEILSCDVNFETSIALPESYFDLKYFLERLPLRLSPPRPGPADPRAEDVALGLSIYELAAFLHDEQSKGELQRIASELVARFARKSRAKGS